MHFNNRLAMWFATLGACAAAPALAQSFPNKPIELVVHTSAGSGGDLVSRTVAEIIRANKWLPQHSSFRLWRWTSST